MTPGRPPLGAKIVHRLQGDAATIERLEILLQTLSGELSVVAACAKLGISQARFFELRSAMLQSALDGLQPKPAGRPARQIDPESQRIQQLEEQNLDLRVHLAAAQLREEIALVMPQLSRRGQANAKKKPPQSRKTTRARSFQITQPSPPSSESSTPGSSDT